jgi:hypothetical protein
MSLSRWQAYYRANKELVAEKNRVYYQLHRDELLEKYEEHRKELLKYQKKYAKKNRAKIQNYQQQYYQRRKANPTYKMQVKIATQKYISKVKKVKSEQRCIERTKRLMTKMCRELLKKVPLYENLSPEPEAEVMAEPEIIPFAGIKINSRGYFVLDW